MTIVIQTETVIEVVSEGVQGPRGIQGPPGSGTAPESIMTTQALYPGCLVHFYNDAGVGKVRRASASLGLRAHGFVLEAFAQDANAAVHFSGDNALAGTQPGNAFLGDDGACVAVPSKPAGGIVQKVGLVANSKLKFNAGPVVHVPA